jgi:hypothetical protein
MSNPRLLAYLFRIPHQGTVLGTYFFCVCFVVEFRDLLILMQRILSTAYRTMEVKTLPRHKRGMHTMTKIVKVCSLFLGSTHEYHMPRFGVRWFKLSNNFQTDWVLWIFQCFFLIFQVLEDVRSRGITFGSWQDWITFTYTTQRYSS